MPSFRKNKTFFFSTERCVSVSPSEFLDRNEKERREGEGSFTKSRKIGDDRCRVESKSNIAGIDGRDNGDFENEDRQKRQMIL